MNSSISPSDESRSQTSIDGDDLNLDIDEPQPISQQLQQKKSSSMGPALIGILAGGLVAIPLIVMLLPEQDAKERSIARRYVAAEFQFETIEEIGWSDITPVATGRFAGHPTMVRFKLFFKTNYWGGDNPRAMNKVFYYDPEANTIECLNAKRRDCNSMNVVSQ